MHEWSLALEIIKITEKEIGARKAKSALEVEVTIGKLNNIVKEQLIDAFEVAKKETLLSKSLLKIVEVEARGYCKSCEKEFIIDNPFIFCPKCGSMDINILSGEELSCNKIVLEF
jgi:hydrogenase nickel incorporation protein HypA/HybF